MQLFINWRHVKLSCWERKPMKKIFNCRIKFKIILVRNMRILNVFTFFFFSLGLYVEGGSSNNLWPSNWSGLGWEMDPGLGWDAPLTQYWCWLMVLLWSVLVVAIDLCSIYWGFLFVWGVVWLFVLGFFCLSSDFFKIIFKGKCVFNSPQGLK